MIGAEVVVERVFAWSGKASRAGERADGQVDQPSDAGVDQVEAKLYELVVGRLHGDSALERLTAEASQGLEAPSPRTAQRVKLALEDAAESDPEFAGAVGELVSQLAAGGAVAGAGGLAVAGPLAVRAEGGSIAAGVIHGGARVGNPTVPGPQES